MTTLITSSATLLDFEWLKFITPSLSILESILCLFVQTSIGTHSGTFICRAKFVCLSGSFLVTKPQKRKAERLHKKNLAFLLRLGQGCCRSLKAHTLALLHEVRKCSFSLFDLFQTDGCAMKRAEQTVLF